MLNMSKQSDILYSPFVPINNLGKEQVVHGQLYILYENNCYSLGGYISLYCFFSRVKECFSRKEQKISKRFLDKSFLWPVSLREVVDKSIFSPKELSVMNKLLRILHKEVSEYNELINSLSVSFKNTRNARDVLCNTKSQLI